MAIFFTSDTHYYHSNIIRYSKRPYLSVEEMNEALIANWNRVVGPEDLVYFLGDFSMAFRSVELYSNRLMGRKRIVPGNHDFGIHSYHKKGRNPENRAAWKLKWEAYGWEILPEQTIIDLGSLGIANLCHMPYSSELGKEFHDKYEKWRPVDDGRLLLHGHVHELWQTKRSPKGTLMVNVGVDVNDYTPISVAQLEDIVKWAK